MNTLLRLVIGLGNPTPPYRRTRHNIGRDFVDHAQETYGWAPFRSQGQVEFTSTDHSPEIFYVKSQSFMNASGPALAGFMKKKSIKPNEILVVVDEFMIPFGTLRFGQKGSAGGHNGMKSIIETLGTSDFQRLRVGIGPVPEQQDPADFVLKKFTKPELDQWPVLFKAIDQGIQILAEQGFEKAATASNKNHL